MSENTVLKVALVCTLVGIVLLYGISLFIEVDEKDVSEISDLDFGKTIRVKGVVSDVKSYDSFSILKISQAQSVEVFLFDNFSVPVGVNVDIYGKVQEGRDGDIEIVGDVVRIV